MSAYVKQTPFAWKVIFQPSIYIYIYIYIYIHDIYIYIHTYSVMTSQDKQLILFKKSRSIVKQWNSLVHTYIHTPLQCTIVSKINGTPKGDYSPISKLHSILAVANLLAHNNKNQICYCGQISLQSAAVNFLTNVTPLGVPFILLAMIRMSLKALKKLEDEAVA